MLAVGNSANSPILFPTDERYFLNNSVKEPVNTTGRLEDSIPIYTHGTPLVRGHDREVGNLAWTYDGELVTVGDDFLVRLWREGGDDARDLRTGGEEGGRRWACGWAEVDEGYDEEDC